MFGGFYYRIALVWTYNTCTTGNIFTFMLEEISAGVVKHMLAVSTIQDLSQMINCDRRLQRFPNWCDPPFPEYDLDLDLEVLVYSCSGMLPRVSCPVSMNYTWLSSCGSSWGFRVFCHCRP